MLLGFESLTGSQMKLVNSNALDYLKTQRVGVIALEMPDGSPHAATIHFAHTEDPFVFYFETHSTTRKAEALHGGKVSRASFVIGADEANMKTFQLDGIAEAIPQEDKETFEKVYRGKFPEKMKKPDAPEPLLFKFTPSWWRFTDWKTSEGKKIWTS